MQSQKFFTSVKIEELLENLELESSPVIQEYVQAEDFKQNTLVIFDGRVFLVLQDFTSDDTEPTIEESFQVDLSAGNISEISGGSGDVQSVDGVEPELDGNVELTRFVTDTEMNDFIADPSTAEPGVRYMVKSTVMGGGITSRSWMVHDSMPSQLEIDELEEHDLVFVEDEGRVNLGTRILTATANSTIITLSSVDLQYDNLEITLVNTQAVGTTNFRIDFGNDAPLEDDLGREITVSVFNSAANRAHSIRFIGNAIDTFPMAEDMQPQEARAWKFFAAQRGTSVDRAWRYIGTVLPKPRIYENAGLTPDSGSTASVTPNAVNYDKFYYAPVATMTMQMLPPSGTLEQVPNGRIIHICVFSGGYTITLSWSAGTNGYRRSADKALPTTISPGNYGVYSFMKAGNIWALM